MSAPLPEDESARLEKLREYDILDTPAERTFERITRVAARFFDVPMAAVSLLDERRLWRKARYGLRASEHCRESSFCGYAILQNEVLVVPDARADVRFADNPHVVGSPHVRFYAGAPLCAEDGSRLGALCVMDRVPRPFTAAEKEMLADLASIVLDEMDLRRAAIRLRTEVKGHQRTQRTLRAQHRMLERLQGSLEGRIRERTADVTQANEWLREEIAQREQLERERENLGRIIEGSQDFISLATLDGRPTFINEAGLRMVGLEHMAQAAGRQLTDFFQPEDQSFVRDVATETLWQTGRWECDFRFRHQRTGAAVPVSWSQFLVHDPRTGEPAGIATVARDITERKQTEVALRDAKDEAEKANRAKSEFLSRMSHELRTPLNAILGFGQILQTQASDPGHKHCAAHVVTAGRHLLSLINEVLDIARIEAGRVELSLGPVFIHEVLAETLDLLRPAATARGTVIETPLHAGAQLGVTADRKRFKQVLLNLLSNAIKYSLPGSRVLVDCRPTPPWQVRLSVQDFGPGIAPDKLARLFVAFDRLGAEDTPVQGTGLGLALSKHLVEAMGGQIGVDSTPGKGSTFWVQLPQAHRPLAGPLAELPPVAAPEKPAAPEPSMSARPLTLLYIEDNPSNLSLVEFVLAQHPQVRLLTATRGAEGVEVARQEQPDMVLLDLHLPDMTGWDVLTTLQTDERTRAIPVAGISADATRATIARLLDAGACAYLSKPLNVEHFLNTLSVLSQPGEA